MLDALLAADAALLREILSLPHPDWLNRLFLFLSRVGIGGGIWLAGGLLLFLTHRISRGGFVRLILAIVLVHLVVDYTLKPSVGRLRPPVAVSGLHVIGDVPPTPSFPSGHAANSVAAALVLATAWRKRTAHWVIWIGAALVGVARVYLGVHYPLDAAAGAIVGLLCGAAALVVPLPQRVPIRRTRNRPSERNQQEPADAPGAPARSVGGPRRASQEVNRVRRRSP
jgi:undecaprenyl-diphosphatase